MRRWLGIGAVAVLVLAASASGEDPVLRVVSQDATTVTLGWDPVSGAEGFRFSSSASSKRSHTWDGARTTVRFAKTDSYMVERIDTAVVGVYPGQVPPPPPVSSSEWRGSFDASYQAAAAGSTVTVPGGTYPEQVIRYRASLANLPGGCEPADTSKCVRFVMGGPVTLTGPLEIRGSSVWISGGNSLRVNGYIDTEANSVAQHPDHVIVEGTSSASFGVFNADTVTFRDMDVGPGTVSSGCAVREGRAFENKIGFAGGVAYVPRNVTLERLRVHDQNGDSGRIASDCHWGGLFLVTVDGLTVRQSVFERNVVYHVQIQNFGGAPAAKRVVFDRNSFSCPVDWLYVVPLRCDGQRAIQFDYDPGTEFTLSNNIAANGANGLYGCYVGTCGGLVGVRDLNNVNVAESTTAPPLP